jgi:AcrR family transcriptional regulator
MVSMPAGTAARPGRGEETRELILSTAERLFAEHGIAAVSNRQVSEAAGQGNHYAVGYHFGTRADLVREIVRRRGTAMEQLRTRMLDGITDAADLRAWVSCLVRPATDHLAALPAPTWYARFVAQADTEPGLRRIVVDEATATPSMTRALEGLFRLLPDMPESVRQERADMCRVLVVHMLAERERALQEETTDPENVWEATARGLIDALVGLILAPVMTAR